MIGGYKVKIMPSADIDLNDIYEYISVNFGIDNADSIINAIQEKVLSLYLVPKSGTLYPNEPWKSKDLRMVHVKNYTIFYFIFDEIKTVKIVKIAYSSMNFKNLLSKMEQDW